MTRKKERIPLRTMRSATAVILCLFVLISCDQRSIYDTYKVTSATGWQKDSVMRFTIPKLDSLQKHNLFITVRNDQEYAYQNLFLIATMEFPNGKVITDTLEYEMARPDGSWLGEGFSDLKESILWYKEGVRFAEEGTYNVSLEHAMRKNGVIQGEEVLSGITDVGFRIEKAEN